MASNLTALLEHASRLRVFTERHIGVVPRLNEALEKFKLTQDHLSIIEQLFLFYQRSLYFLSSVSLIAVQLNLLVCILILWALKHRLFSKKRYMFIVSRAVSDMLCSGLTLVWSVLDISAIDWNNLLNYLHIIQFSLGFWSVTGVCLTLASLTLLAVHKPLYYRSKVTVQRCLGVLVGIWLFCIGYTLLIVPIGGSVFFSYKTETCSHHCQVALTSVTTGGFVLSYLSVPLLHIFVLLVLKRRSPSRTVSVRQVRHYRQLCFNVLSYTFFNSAFALLSVAAFLLLFDPVESFGDKTISRTVHIFTLRLVALLLMCSRTLVDPVLVLVQDYKKLKKQVLRARNSNRPDNGESGDGRELQFLVPHTSRTWLTTSSAVHKLSYGSEPRSRSPSYASVHKRSYGSQCTNRSRFASTDGTLLVPVPEQ